MVRLYVKLRELPEVMRPCEMIRQPGKALLVIDPRHSRLEVTAWIVDNMRPDEHRALRVGMNIAPPGQSAPSWVTDDEPEYLFVPRDLRLPGASPLQGGAELKRRQAAGLLGAEKRAYRLEIAGLRPFDAMVEDPGWVRMTMTSHD